MVSGGRACVAGLAALLASGGCITPPPAQVPAQAPAPVVTVRRPPPPVAPAAVPVSPPGSRALVPPPVPREFRGVWVATVGNIDWPSRPGLPTGQQQAELLALLDRATRLNLNAVILQVRPAADALYASPLEPWSEFLTGQMGRAPDPFWDPLAFAVLEAHRRGLELHAWVNPYRAKFSDGRSAASFDHVSRTHPEWIRAYGRNQLWMDPGEPAVREQTVRVVLDIVKRYDVDGLHIDDYFYPYRESDGRGRVLDFPDAATYERYLAGGGTLARDDWRRDNVNRLVEALATGIRATKPWVKFGVSPFGIWRPGSPPSVRGLDAYTELYADSRSWVRNGWGDYFSPQLYWRIGSPQQSYADLLAWWSSENVRGRHIWPGNYSSRVGSVEGSQNWGAGELLDQIRLTREGGAGGNVHFSMRAFMRDPLGVDEALIAGPYAERALVPASPWMMAGAPGEPGAPVVRLVASALGELSVGLAPAWPTAGSTAPRSLPWQYVVQASYADATWRTMIVQAAMSGLVPIGRSSGAAPLVALVVTAVDRVGNASERTMVAAASAVPAGTPLP